MHAHLIPDMPINIPVAPLVAPPGDRDQARPNTFGRTAWRIFEKSCQYTGVVTVALLVASAAFFIMDLMQPFDWWAWPAVVMLYAIPVVAAATFILSATMLTIQAIYRAYRLQA